MDSSKYVGWLRSSIYPKHTDEVSESESRNHDYVTLLFRFDALYNFSNIRLFVANDYQHHRLALPSRVDVRFRTEYPKSIATSDHKPLAVMSFVQTRDRLNLASRWISLAILNQTAKQTNQKQKDATHQGIGRFVELRLFFDEHAIAVAEVMFENGR